MEPLFVVANLAKMIASFSLNIVLKCDSDLHSTVASVARKTLWRKNTLCLQIRCLNAVANVGVILVFNELCCGFNKWVFVQHGTDIVSYFLVIVIFYCANTQSRRFSALCFSSVFSVFSSIVSSVFNRGRCVSAGGLCDCAGGLTF